jgi:hypothetical protein
MNKEVREAEEFCLYHLRALKEDLAKEGKTFEQWLTEQNAVRKESYGKNR